jgi:hypothetical protein
MLIFISKTSNTLNRKPYAIENITPYVCLNPMYGSVTTDGKCVVFMDSGAYQNEDKRVTLRQALERQQAFEKRLGYNAKYIAAYDKIGDKEESMRANRFLLDAKLPEGQQPVLIVQGETNADYSTCLKELLELSKDKSFVLGFGGIAKAGVVSTIKNKLCAAITENISSFGNIKHIHLFGCFTARVLKFFETTFPDKIVSCDTASVEVRSVMGNVFTDGKFIKTFTKEQKHKDYHPNELAQDNVRRALDFYKSPNVYRYQNLCEGV